MVHYLAHVKVEYDLNGK
jgi:hypothetical protein